MIKKNGQKVLYTDNKIKAKNDAIQALVGKTPTAKEKDNLLFALGITDDTGKIKADVKPIKQAK